jgi:hypothetical protein
MLSRVVFPKLGLAALCIGISLTLSCHAEPLADSAGVAHRRVLQGTLVTLHPLSAPFPHPNRKEGLSSDNGSFPFQGHYSDSSVQVFFPQGWTEGPKVDLVFFFHGWLTSVDDSLKGFDLLNQFKQSKVNALLILPETAQFVPDSFGGKLEDDGGFQNLVQEILKTLHDRRYLRGTRPGRIVLTGHSGAYRVISQILNRGGLQNHVSDVILFDALYGKLNEFEQWIDRRKGLFIVVFTQDGEVEPVATDMMDDLKRRGVPYLLKGEPTENPMPPQNVRAVFYRSSKDHYEVVHDTNQFQHLLHMVIARKN